MDVLLGLLYECKVYDCQVYGTVKETYSFVKCRLL